MNPFAAPQHESPLPLAHDTWTRRLLQAIGGVEMFLGVVLVLLTAYVGWNVMTGRETLAGSHHPAILAFAISFFVLLGIFSVVAGYKLTRRSSWKPLLLQLVPAFVVAFFAWISAVG